jgi:Fic family protein/DNA-binding XRE family transcriptional regulator
MTISEKLKIIQALSGFTQEKIAKQLSVSFATLNSWINGKSKPRKEAEKRIHNLYLKLSGQKKVPEDSLQAKKQIIFTKERKYKHILKKILKNPDIYDQFLLSLTYHTNKIEGSTLNENETKAILFDNIALSNKNIIEQLEVKNHQTAWHYLLNYLLRQSAIIDEKLILKLHSILMNSIKSDAGSYRRHAVRIVGTYVPTTNYQKIPQLMNKLVDDINSFNKNIIFQVANTHSCFEQIHPFSDGNGRIGRLIMQAMFLKKNLPPAIIKQTRKQFYNNYLQKAQLKKNYLSLEEFLCDALIEGFRILERKI